MRKILLPLLLLISIYTYSQDFLLSEQWFSRINRNPAATGNSKDINLFYMNRQQWVGFENAPSTNILNAHAFFEGISSGLGFTFYYDTQGLGDKALNAKLAYAYHTNVAKNMLLSFGVSAGVLNKSFDPNLLTLSDNSIPTVEATSKSNLDMDLGVEFSMPVFMAGASVSHLLDNRGSEMTNINASRQVTAYARGNIALDNKFNLAPAFVYNNYTSEGINFFEFNATTFYDKIYWFGLGTRFDSDMSFSTLNAMLGLEWKMLRIGYGYDYSLGSLGNFKKSTHEIMLACKLAKPECKKTSKTRFVRFME